MNERQETSLNFHQKETVALLSIGTFLEYFDLMLYVHMAVLLDELFFPKTDPFTTAILAAFTFSSTYVMRPFGALIFGYIGDHVGRKPTVIITTVMMSISCVIMANLPTYAQIGISASWIITICRMAQGLSTMGEVMGANIYIMEIVKPPIQYPAVALMAICGAIGGSASLAIASLSTSYNFNWRTAFWVGAIIAVVGAVARSRLRETHDFTEAKSKANYDLTNNSNNNEFLKNGLDTSKKVDKKIALSLFYIECSWPVCFYIAYMYCGNLLKSSFGYTAEQVIHQNFIVSLVQLASFFMMAVLSYKIYPLKILKVKLLIFLGFNAFLPHLLYNANTPDQILFIQCFIVVFGFMGLPAMPVFYKHIPILRRFTYATFMYALSRAFIYVVTSFGLVYCSNYFGHWGLLIIIIPTAACFTYGLHCFETLDNKGKINY